MVDFNEIMTEIIARFTWKPFATLLWLIYLMFFFDRIEIQEKAFQRDGLNS